MAFIPQFILQKLFKRDSLRKAKGGTQMTLENNLAFDLLVAFEPLSIDGTFHPPEKTQVDNGEQKMLGTEISAENPFKLLTGTPITILLKGHKLTPGNHRIKIQITGKGAGKIGFEVVEAAQQGD